jgi:hypothetical protein
MADTRSLSFIGLMLGAATLMVMMVGAFVVTGHVTGHAHFEDGLSIISTPAAASTPAATR